MEGGNCAEEALAGAQDERRDDDRQLVDEAGGQRLTDDVRPAREVDVLIGTAPEEEAEGGPFKFVSGVETALALAKEAAGQASLKPAADSG